MDGPRVLVVEDDVDTRDLIVEVLREDGYRVAAAANGREALELIGDQADLPSIILLDLMMPIMNGWQFLEARAQNPALASVPVLVLSADPARQLASDQGVVAIVGKPFDLSRLLRLVRAVTKSQSVLG